MAELLTKEETKNLLEKWRVFKDEEAVRRLIDSNIALVKFIAKKFQNSGVLFDDLVSAGKIGLFNAIDKFDYLNRPIECFSTYIGRAIENEMTREIKKYSKHKHVLSFEQPIGHNKNGDEMTVEDLVGTDAEELIENVIDEMKIEIVKDALQCLTSREKQIIFLRYGLDEAHAKTQKEIAEMFGCTSASISRQEQKALVKMRHPRNTRKLKDFLDE